MSQGSHAFEKSLNCSEISTPVVTFLNIKELHNFEMELCNITVSTSSVLEIFWNFFHV